MKIRELASGLQFPEGPIAMREGSVLLVEIARGTLSRVAPDGRIHVVAQLGGGPNGAAIGPDGAVYVCNNGGFAWHTEADGCFRPIGQASDYSGGRIERVNLTHRQVRASLRHGGRPAAARPERLGIRRTRWLLLHRPGQDTRERYGPRRRFLRPRQRQCGERDCAPVSVGRTCAPPTSRCRAWAN